MTTESLPRRKSHLRVFGLSLGLVVLCLAGLLFGVSLEAIAPATGTVTARDLTSGKEARIQIDRRGGLSEDQVDAYARLASEYKVE